jgi:hypothetical protein
VQRRVSDGGSWRCRFWRQLRRGRFRCHGARTFHLKTDERGSNGDAIPRRATQPAHLSGNKTRQFDGGFVGHYLGDRLVHLDGVANRDQPFDKFRLGDPFADVRHAELEYGHLSAPAPA